jgi:hypothetical protein
MTSRRRQFKRQHRKAIVSALKCILNLSRQTELPSPVVKEQTTQLGAKSTTPNAGMPRSGQLGFLGAPVQPARAQFQTRTADAQGNAIDPSQAIVRGGKMGKIASLCTCACRMYWQPQKRCLFVLFVLFVLRTDDSSLSGIRPWTGSAVV